MKLYERNIALEWYQYGLEKQDDFFMRFMMHWIAFNWLYSEYYDEDIKEHDAIESFCAINMKKLSQYDAFSSPFIEVFRNKPVGDRTGVRKIHRDRCNLLNQKNITALFLTIYQVRCNLFHGSKSIHNQRDIELVSSSAEILGEYLKVLLT